MTTTTQTTTVAPPSNYPHGDKWAGEQDYFHVSPELRAWYASDEAGPQAAHIENVYRLKGNGLVSPVTVRQLQKDSKGRYTERPPYEDGHVGGLVPGLRWHETEVDPGNRTGLAYQTWEHGLRLQRATAAAAAEEREDQRYAYALRQACIICGHGVTGNSQTVAWYGAGPFCQRCRKAVEQRAIARHGQDYQAAIDGYLDDHMEQWQPQPPQRQPAGHHHAAA
jgi:hypothetical protein